MFVASLFIVHYHFASPLFCWNHINQKLLSEPTSWQFCFFSISLPLLWQTLKAYRRQRKEPMMMHIYSPGLKKKYGKGTNTNILHLIAFCLKSRAFLATVFKTTHLTTLSSSFAPAVKFLTSYFHSEALKQRHIKCWQVQEN